MIGGTTKVFAELCKVSAPKPAPFAMELKSPVEGELGNYLNENRKTFDKYGLRMVQPRTKLSRTVTICGAGPSLKDWRPGATTDVWACNSALGYLLDNHITANAAVGVDQTAGLYREWGRYINDLAKKHDTEWLIASTISPDLFERLAKTAAPVSVFHNHCGIADNELELYNEWPAGVVCGEGFSVVSRAIGLAIWMGYERVDVVGADCAFGPDDLAHANGDTAQEAYGQHFVMVGSHDGREWRTRPDMLMDAVHLVKRVRNNPSGRIRLLGDTLPVALSTKPDCYLTLVSARLTLDEIQHMKDTGTEPERIATARAECKALGLI